MRGISLEDHFHVGAFRNLISRSHWLRFESCLEHATNTTLALLDEYGAKATFFTMGWVAEHGPPLRVRPPAPIQSASFIDHPSTSSLS